VARPRIVEPSRSPGRLRSLEPDPQEDDPQGADGAEEPGSPATGSQRQGSSESSASPSRSRGSRGAPGGGAVGEESGGTISFGQSSGGGSGETPPPGGKKRWGRSPSRAGIGLERKLEIHVKKDRLLIGPNDVAIPVGQGEKTEELVQRVLAGIEQSAQGWGAPPANFYWLPAAKFVVYPGGSPYYERLRGPLEKWGVRSTLEYAPAAPPAGDRGGPRR
jgi:hypothetical protein